MINVLYTKLMLLVATGALLSTITIHDLRADTTVQLGANQVGITVTDVDDHVTCTLNDEVVLQLNFAEQTTVNLTRKLIQGANKINCIFTDDDDGGCFAYGYEIWIRRGEHGFPLPAHSSRFGCCDSSCARPGNPVLDETVWINKS
jgi:hypothetical protein